MQQQGPQKTAENQIQKSTYYMTPFRWHKDKTPPETDRKTDGTVKKRKNMGCWGTAVML